MFKKSFQKTKRNSRDKSSERNKHRDFSNYSWGLVDEKAVFTQHLRDSSYSFYDKWVKLLQSQPNRV